jgi:catechol-2,3-dioxygenase
MSPASVSNLAKAATFYRDTLGLQVKNQTEEIAFVEAGGVTLVLRKGLGRTESHSCAMEIVFPVQSVRRARGLLTQRGRKIHQRTTREVTPGSWASTLTERDGYNITVFGPE